MSTPKLFEYLGVDVLITSRILTFHFKIKLQTLITRNALISQFIQNYFKRYFDCEIFFDRKNELKNFCLKAKADSSFEKSAFAFKTTCNY